MQRAESQAQISKMFLLCLLAAILFQQSSAHYIFVGYTAVDYDPGDDDSPVFQCQEPVSQEYTDFVAEVQPQLETDWLASNSDLFNLTINCVYWGISGVNLDKFIVEYTVVVDDTTCDITIPTLATLDIGLMSYDVLASYILGGKGKCVQQHHTTTTSPEYKCKGKTYNPETQTCCNNIKIHTTKANWTCCGPKYYDELKYECCGQTTVYNADKYSCCGTRKLPLQNPKKLCCNNKPYSKKKWDCCTANPDFAWPKKWMPCPALVNGENPTFSPAYWSYYRRWAW